MNAFKCEKCGSNQLGYQKYIKSVTPTEIKDDGVIYYGNSQIDDNNYLPAQFGFCCADCGQLIVFCGFTLESEKDLVNFLSMSEESRQQLQTEYDESEYQKYETMKQNQEAYVEEYLNSAEN